MKKITTEEKHSGTIISADFAFDGHFQDELGIKIRIRITKDWTLEVDERVWDPETVKPSRTAKWDEQQRDKRLAKVMRVISHFMNEAGVRNLKNIVGMTATCHFANGVLTNITITK